MIAAATAPALLGFAGEGPAAFFFLQGASEAGVLAMTDFSAADRQARRLEAA